MSTDHPVVVVTGAAGQLGIAIVAAQAASGSSVVALDRSDEALEVAQDRWAADGHDVVTVSVDQTDAEAVSSAFAEIAARHGRLDGLVANAGYAKYGSIIDMPARTWDQHVAINLSGTFYTCQAAAQQMAAFRGGGWITVVSSNLALTHADQVSAYSVTKAGLLTFVKSAAAELGVHRIRVNALLPGVIKTAMTANMLAEPGVSDGLLAKTPMGRLGEPTDVVSAIAFLASDRASWITGSSLLVDGGQSIYGQPAWIRQDRSIEHQPTWVSGYGPHHSVIAEGNN